MSWTFRTPVKYLDKPDLKQMEKILFYYEGSVKITPIVDNVVLTGLATSFTGTSGGKNFNEIAMLSSNDYINGRTLQLQVDDIGAGQAGHLSEFDLVFTPIIAGSDQLNSTAWQFNSPKFDGGDPTVHKEILWIWIHYKGTPTVTVYANENGTAIFGPTALPTATTRTKYQIPLVGNYAETLRWTISGTAAGSIYAFKPEFRPTAGGQS